MELFLAIRELLLSTAYGKEDESTYCEDKDTVILEITDLQDLTLTSMIPILNPTWLVI